MKINTKKSRKKPIIIALLVLFLLVAGATTFAYTQKLGPFDSNRLVTERNNPQEDAPVTPDTSSNENDTETDDTDNQNKEKEYVSTPIFEQPKTTDPYPIENEHYKIEESSTSNLTVTLYPIANNPEYTDYNSQLKAYKNEALDYLKFRYGSTNKLTIKWIPDEASKL